MKNSIGSTIKITRTQQHLSQLELAQGICSQPMLSAIENGRYTLNAELLN